MPKLEKKMTTEGRLQDAPDWRRARRACAKGLADTIRELSLQTDIDERRVVAEWMRHVSHGGDFSRGGWYYPPPFGAAVLAGSYPGFERLGFSSLRDPSYFSDGARIDWRRGAMFAYCSNVHLPSGFPSDFSLTLYFGDEQRIVDHFVNCRAATKCIVELAMKERSSRNLFLAATRVLSEFGLKNVIQSNTDAATVDIGHSLEPAKDIQVQPNGTLSQGTCNSISQSRQFINAFVDWDLSEVATFTIEPQLVSVRDRQLPKVTFHYTMSKRFHEAIVDDPMDFFSFGIGMAFR
jgi:hypothetical protein